MQPLASPMQSSMSGISGTGQSLPGGQREKFSADELAIVLSNYDIGIIESIVEYPRGSRRAPKLLITSEQGKFLLKRRARGKDEVYKVAFSHSVQLFLASKQFPLPHLIGTRKDNSSMLQWRGSVYELFEYIAGQHYPHTLEATFEAGRVLGLYHKLLGDFQSQWQPPESSYHNQPSVLQGIKQIGASLVADNEAGQRVVAELERMYREASERVEELGISNWPRQYVHADWHPGNMLFRDNHVVAVIDYDSARQLPRVVDVGNGALQFSIIAGSEDPAKWPDYLDEARYRRFVRGYDEVMLLSSAEVKAIPFLMVEALVAEAVLPIAMTGSFGQKEGMPFLQMIERKATWMMQSAQRLSGLLES